jgi:poly(A) polymerase/tRNA nucleotidyltransferase (CCA-adding enzyme)
VLYDLAGVFAEAGFACFVVGGALRNLAMGEDPEDYDIATDASPDAVQRLFRRTIPTGIKHGTVTVLIKGNSFEVTTFRTEGRYSDGRRPDAVEYVAGVEEDLSRRDFTINGMAYDLIKRQLVDPHDGRGDIKRRIVRAIGDPQERFAEDGLRLLRCVRFAGRLGFSVEEKTYQALQKEVKRIRSISPERIRDEFSKTLLAKDPTLGLRLLADSGLMQEILPELYRTKDTPQDRGADKDVLGHSIRSAAAAPAESLNLRIAALFHDIGKYRTQEGEPPGPLSFHGHEGVSAEETEVILKRLRYPNAVVEEVCHLIRHHMIRYEDSWSDGAVRRFVRTVGRDHLDAWFALRRADALGKGTPPRSSPGLESLAQRIEAVVREDSALSVKDLAVSGEDLASWGIPRGPEMGTVLRTLLETVLDDPEQNDRERLKTIATRFYKERIADPQRDETDSDGEKRSP